MGEKWVYDYRENTPSLLQGLLIYRHPKVPIPFIALNLREAEYNTGALNLGSIEGDGSQTHPKIVSKIIVCQCSF